MKGNERKGDENCHRTGKGRGEQNRTEKRRENKGKGNERK
jgi:hypothetical protein